MGISKETTDTIPPIVAQALTLPGGNYYTPQLAHIRLPHVILVGMGRTAITNASSKASVIGTTSFSPCCAIVLYNTRTKTAVLGHEPFPDSVTFRKLLGMVRTDASDQVDVHIMGGSISMQSEDADYKEENAMTLGYLRDFLEAVQAETHLSLKTFDVFNKLKPNAVAIDARTGNLIRGSVLFKTQGQGARTRHHFYECHFQPDDKDFDGTVSMLQKPMQMP